MLLAGVAQAQDADGVFRPALRCDGVADVAPAVNAAIAQASGRPAGGVVELPGGICRVAMADGRLPGIVMRSHVTLRGKGIDRTVLHIDDSKVTGQGNNGITNCIANNNCAALEDVELRDLSVQGDRPRGVPNRGTNTEVVPVRSSLVVLVKFRNLRVLNVALRDASSFALLTSEGEGLLVRDVLVERTKGDCIAAWSVSQAQIIGNRISMCGDNAISAHANDADTPPQRAGLVIADNIISDSAGISVLGAKAARISGNLLSRSWGIGIHVGVDSFAHQGGTANFATDISGNVITDTMSAVAWNPYAGPGLCIEVDGGQGTAGLGKADGAGGFYTAGGAAGAWLRVRDNECVRTLPPVTRWAQWGHGAALEVGSFGAHTGAITDASLRANGILLKGTLRDSIVSGNLIQQGGAWGIAFDGGSGGFEGVSVEGNRIADFTEAGVLWQGPTGTHQRIALSRNVMDVSGHAVATWLTGVVLDGDVPAKGQ